MLQVSISAEPLFKIGYLTITNSLLTTWISIIVLILLVIPSTKRLKLIPQTKIQQLWEMIIEFFADLTSSISGETKAKQFFPLVASFFIYILILNWMELLPGMGTIGIKHTTETQISAPIATSETKTENTSQTTKHEQNSSSEKAEAFTPVFRAGTADLNTTLALSLIAMIAIQYYALKNIGLKAHLRKFFNFSNPIQFFVGILELISEFAKIISFAFRLFGNIFAGEVLLAVTLFLIPVIIPIPFLGLEIFVGLIQAFVFAMLTLVFLSIASEKHNH